VGTDEGRVPLAGLPGAALRPDAPGFEAGGVEPGVSVFGVVEEPERPEEG
jgi:hypothetical protein